MARPWESFITARDAKLFDRAGYGQALDLGGRMAILVIDLTQAFAGDRPEPVERSIERFPNSCGAPAWELAARLRPMLKDARRVGVPIAYTIKDLDHADVAAASWQRTRTEVDANLPFTRIIDPVAPAPHDKLLRKTKPSAFFATPLLQWLLLHRIETVVCCGLTTSGCVRATAVDAFSHGYRVVVPEDGVADRGQASHAIGLFDLAQKYAAVPHIEDIRGQLRNRKADSE